MIKQFKIIVEKHSDGFVAYPLGIKGVVVGEGDSYEAALADANPLFNFTSKPSARKCLIPMLVNQFDRRFPCLPVFKVSIARARLN